MKLKIMSLVTAMVLLLSCGSSRNTSTSSYPAYDVPTGVQTSFTTQYPAATSVTWSAYDAAGVPIDWELTGWPAMTTSDYVVRFNLDNNNYYGWYDANGNWIGSTYVITDYSTLPTAINTTLNNQYPGYTISSVQRESWKDHTGYEIKMNSGDNKVKLLIDDNGNIIKQKTKD